MTEIMIAAALTVWATANIYFAVGAYRSNKRLKARIAKRLRELA
jgi:hypothetical protein